MPKRRNNRKYSRQQPIDQPDNWQEAMERGVFLLNERNRAFVDYASQEVYLPAISRRSLIFQAGVIVILGAFLVGYLYTLNHDITRGAAPGISRSDICWWAVPALGVAALAAGGYVAYRLVREARQRRSLVVEGRLLFVPITGCVVADRFFLESQIHLVYEMKSPVTGKRLGGRYIGDCPEDRLCPTEGMVAVVLYKDDRHYQVL